MTRKSHNVAPAPAASSVTAAPARALRLVALVVSSVALVFGAMTPAAAAPSTVSSPTVSSPTTTVRGATATPGTIRSVTAKPGPKPGQVTFRWKHSRAGTSHYVLELASTTFQRGQKGRNHLRITIPAKKKKFVLSAKRAKKAGARVGSGNHLYYRFSAVNKSKSGTRTRHWPNLQAVQPAGPAAPAAATSVKARFGTFNLNSKKSAGKRSFNVRLGRIAKSIVSRKLGVVGLQELSPGTKGSRPTDRLVRELRSKGGSYAMVRTSPYFRAGTKKVGSQGSRIVYDTSSYELLSRCANSTGNRQYSSSCAIEMPPGPGEKHGRMAGFAQFRDRATGARFWFVSVHLTPDAGGKRDKLRLRQVKRVVAQIESRNRENLPIVLTGDLNTWQNRPAGSKAHDFLVKRGFVDSFVAAKKTNAQYSTYSNFEKRMKKYDQGFGVRLDYVLVKNGLGALRHRNVMKPVDPARASDHNLVVADVRLPVRR